MRGMLVAVVMPTTIHEVFDLENALIRGPGRQAELTPLELRMVVALVRRHQMLCSKHYLVQAIWPEEKAPDSAYDKSLWRLGQRVREKLVAAGLSEAGLRTRTGLGYVLDVEKL